MNWVEGKTKQFNGNFRERWGKFAEDHGNAVAGRQQMTGKIQERYGMAREEAERQLSEFVKGLQPLPQ